MAKLNANYEAVFIIDPRKNEEDTAALVEKFKTLAETNATSVEVDEWGKRRLAYPIQDQTDGHYVRLTFSAAPAFPAELDRIFRITDGVMRSMIVCLDE
ncbi:MAG: 30S ribosomal protein S6 [Oscillospiraceae bacterium]|jgi:small subunit ribosomal protein S6|nr:30S ribosomal protein S6 [Oscillospiraceae bacterium]